VGRSGVPRMTYHEDFIQYKPAHEFALALDINTAELSDVAFHVWDCTYCNSSAHIHKSLATIHGLNAEVCAHEKVAYDPDGIFSNDEKVTARQGIMSLQTSIMTEFTRFIRDIREVHLLELSAESLVIDDFEWPEI
jgi:hypothetical protein